MPITSTEYKTVLLLWRCDAPGDDPDGRCGAGWGCANPSAAERMAGAPGWARSPDGRVLCPDHRPSDAGR
jgi:hypothetical protein